MRGCEQIKLAPENEKNRKNFGSPFSGRSEQLLQTFEQAATIHSKLDDWCDYQCIGSRYFQNMDYVLRYDDLESYGRLKDANFYDEEIGILFLEKARANPEW